MNISASTLISLKSIIIMLLIVLISPFIINCFFAYPQTDDFMCSVITRDMGFLKSQYHWYMTWSGRFTSIALSSINPMVYGSIAGYKLFLVLFIFLQCTALYFFTESITNKALTWQENLIFTLTLLFAFFDQMDDLRSGLYWMAGAVTYLVPGTILLSYLSLLIGMNQNENLNNVLRNCILIALAFFLGGTNEIVLVLVLLITSVSIFYSRVITKTANLMQIVTMTAVAAGSCIGLLAPGNFARLSVYHERTNNLFVAIQSSLGKTITSMEVWGTSPLTLVLMCMVFFAVVSKPKVKHYFVSFPIISSIGFLLFMLFICFFIPYWSTGKPPENRVLNMIYLFFLIGWMLCSAIIFSHYGETTLLFMKKIPIRTGSVVIAVYMFTLFYLGTSNFMLVTKDLLSGESYRYNAQMQQREMQLTNFTNDSGVLENISSTPGSLYFYFISPNQDYWVNRWYASYFGKKSVELKK